jgi:hypothetical protein
LPSTIVNPVEYRLAERSPSYITMNAQVSKTISKKFPLDIMLVEKTC